MKVRKQYSEAANTDTDDPHEEIDCELSKVDKSLSDESRSMLADWKEYDQADDISFCETHDDDSEKRIYVNLVKNPERYTGYRGESSNKLWYMIYNENCFNAELPTHQGPYSTSGPLQCLEKRVFYRMISGFHSSISVHLSYRFPQNRVLGTDSRASMSAAAIGLIDWGPNLEQFRWRFDPTRVPDADQRLRNLHFVYLVELRALAKAAPYLRQLDYYTGDAKQDAETRQAVNDLLGIVEERGNVFDETQLFSEPSDETVILKRQFRDRFVNISRIMDCVGCDKCRMWGKLQIQGLGTALKILFTERTIKDPTLHKPAQLGPNFHLSRQEIVALFNGFGRLSTSIGALSEFCALMAESTS